MCYRILFILAFFSMIHSLKAQSYLEDSAEVAEHADAFMERISEDKIGEAFDSFKRHSMVSDKEVSRTASQLKGHLSDYKNTHGEMLDANFLLEQRAGDHLVERSYLLRFEKHPVHFHLIYYKGSDGWLINTITWDPDVKKLFGH